MSLPREAQDGRRELRRRALRRGLLAEFAAMALLRLKGYVILDSRYKISGGELDVVARRGDAIVFVEVKTRPTMAEALEAVTPQKRRRIGRAARVWLASHPHFSAMTLRGDAIFVVPWRWPRHMVCAIELDLG